MTAPTNVTFTTGTTITSEWLNGVNDYVNELDPADHSAANVTYDPPFTNSVATTVENKLSQTVSVKDFGATGNGSTDDTTAIQNALNYIASATSAGLTTSGSLTTSYSGTAPRLYFPKGTYKITAKLTLGSYLEVLGDSAIIKQYTDSENIFDGVAYQWLIDGIQFVGGNYQINLYNANINSTMVKITNCQFFLSRSYAINTSATGGTYTHLSTDLSIDKARFISCNKILNNCCDSATITNSWLQMDANNFTTSTAAIMNRGTSVGDPDAWTRLHIKDSFLIPADSVSGSRWIDNYGSFSATHSRFGGEYGGMPILFHLGAPNTTYPWTTTEAIFKECSLFAGQDGNTAACVVGLFEIPNRVVIRNCEGPVGRPLISNLGSVNIPNYMTAFETASGKKAYNYFKYDIQDVITDIPSYVPVRAYIPYDLYPYVIKAKRTKIKRNATTQSIPTGLGVGTKVSFDGVVFDNIGAWSATNPTRIYMPAGCTKALIDVYAAMAVDGAAKTIKYAIVNNSAVIESQNVFLHGINPLNDSVTLTAVVQGTPGTTYWEIEIDHDAVGALNLLQCYATITPVDFVG